MKTKKYLILAILLPIMLIGCGSKEEKPYPNKSIRVIIPWSVGGMTDVLTRRITSRLEDKLGVTFVVENKPGAGGTIGSLDIEKSKNDGYLIGTTSMSTVSSKYVAPIYPDAKNVEYISQVITIPATVTVNSSSPFQTIDDLIAYAKANPSTLRSANSGVGASAHIYAINFESASGITLTHVPYAAYADALTALLGNHVEMTNIPLPDVAPHVESGSLRLLAIASDERHPDFPDVPTLKEKGIAATMGNYSGFVAPKGTPAEYVEAIDKAIGEVMQEQEIIDFLLEAGYQPAYKNSADFTLVVEDMEAQLDYMVNELGIEFVDN